MAVFNRELGSLEDMDPKEALRRVEQYIAYMQEAVEFSVGNLRRRIEAQEQQAAAARTGKEE